MKVQFYHHNRLHSARPYGSGRTVADKIDILEQQLSKGFRIKYGQRVRLYSPEFFTTLINQGRIKYLTKIEKQRIAIEIKRLRAKAGKIIVEKFITSPKRLRAIAAAS